MWKVSGRSSALNRAEALLSGKRSSTRDGGGSTHDSTTKTQGASFRAGPVPPNSHNLFSDLSDLSSDTSASKQTAESARLANTQENLEIKGDSTQDLRPQKSLAEGSRFLKKAPKPANSSHSPVSRNRAQAVVQPRCVSSSQGGSQAPALRRLAEIESRVRSRKQELEQAKKASAAVLSPASDVEMAPEAAVQIKEASAALSAQFDTDQSQRENRFLKKKNRSSSAPPEATRHAAAGVGFRSRAGDAVELSGGLERKPRRPMSGVSLGSDEEDMRKLLGDSVESISMSGPGRSSSVKRPDRTLSSPSEEDERQAAAHPSPPSPSCHSSPFRFTGQARAQFSPSALSPSPPSPHRPSTTPERQGSTQKAEGPRRCHSSASSHAEVLSLEELFPVGLGSEHPHSHISSASSEDPGEIRVNVMTLDELIPCETPERQSSLDYQKTHFTDLVLVPMQNQNKMADAVPGSQSRRQLSPWEEEEEAAVDYHSNFDTDSSARQISEYLGGGYDEEAEVRSEVRSKIRSEVRSDVRSEVRSDVRSEVRSKIRSKVTQAVSRTDESLRKTEDDYSSTFSSVRSESFSRSRRSFSQHSRRHASVRRSFKDAAAQTWPDPPGYSWSAGMAPLDPMVGRIYMGPTFVAPHAFSADRLEAVSMLDPAGFALNEMLKQQLAITKQFIERSEHLHACLMQSLEPPNYRYTTLEETMRSICRRRRPKPHREKT
ncbi:uncharacterized protein C19orf44 homolog isoform X2 [Poecilia latipinna]|uniref:uncharacterized protein C19orf44 homolog isoform X2 n=1 Tax=Poecilia latipinna TaxID=48699 RepID=UPI00072E86F0|nr:PREDICTED: uncharacterized protein C19orf44 homolog isoform X2 [Poecilia latipinna]